MTEPVRLLLARHGRTEWHRDNRYVSRTDIGIDETGREQAHTLAQRAKEESPSLVLSSPLKRVLLTAGPAAEACGLQPETDDRLRELDFGGWEGKTLDEIRAEDPERAERFLHSAEHGFPGGEPLEDGARRILAVFEDLRRSHAGQTVLVVAHNTLLRLGLCAMLGVPLGEYRRRLPRAYPRRPRLPQGRRVARRVLRLRGERRRARRLDRGARRLRGHRQSGGEGPHGLRGGGPHGLRGGGARPRPVRG